MKLDYEALGRELIRALRGHRSQVAFSRRLGYASNVLYTWESGRRWPTASTFFTAAGRAGIDVDAALVAFAQPNDPDPTPTGDVAAFLRSLKGSTPVRQIALRSKRSRFAVSRWLKGVAEPRLPDLLRVIQAMSLRVLDLVAQFTDPAQLPSAKKAWRRLEATRALSRASPWAQVVLLSLELESYRARPAHDDEWLANHLGIGIDVVRRAMDMLVDSGQVAPRGQHFAPVVVQAVDVGTGAGRQGPSPIALKQHWTRVALDRLVQDGPGLFSYNLVVVSQRDLHRIEELQRAHYRAIRTLVADSQPSDRLVLLNLQTVPIN